MSLQIGPRYLFHRDGRVEADRHWIGWLSRTREGYFAETVLGRTRDLPGVSQTVAAGILRQMNEGLI